MPKPTMLISREESGCWRCEVQSWVARLVRRPFQPCDQCNEQMRRAQAAWTAWGETAAGSGPALRPDRPVQTPPRSTPPPVDTVWPDEPLP
jgi:hypothetical protein